MPSDVLVIGGGPAGLSAAIQLRARGRSVLVVSNPLEENPLWRSDHVDNYPGFPASNGPAILTALRRHAEASGAEFLTGKVLTALQSGNTWYVTVGPEMYNASALVLASGVTRGTKLPGESNFLGKGVSYCATCDGMLYRNRPVAVLGYSDSAQKEADFLRSIGCQVTYFDRPKRGQVLGETQVTGVECDGQTVPVDGVFILRPSVAPTELFPNLATENGYVAVNRKMETNLPGLFAAGDCTGGPLQIAKAVGEGQVAGQSAAAFVSMKH